MLFEPRHLDTRGTESSGTGSIIVRQFSLYHVSTGALQSHRSFCGSNPVNIISQAVELKSDGHKVCAAIGMFDGVHLGHQQVLRQTNEDARQHGATAVAITFDCHPNSIVAPERNPPLIYRLDQKLRVIESLGITTTLLIHFDQAFSRQTGADFLGGLARDFGRLHSVSVGSAFTFGHKRSGNVALLKTLGQEMNFVVHGLAAVSLDGKVVSSTRIREAIGSGNLDAASQMLGRTYSLAGRVIHGDEQGRRIGFPTANLEVSGLVVPPDGVYAAAVIVRNERYQAVVNIGVRPTLQSPEPRRQLEAHLLDFSGDLYGKDLEIVFLKKVRDEQKFSDLGALGEQIARDIVTARTLF